MTQKQEQLDRLDRLESEAKAIRKLIECQKQGFVDEYWEMVVGEKMIVALSNISQQDADQCAETSSGLCVIAKYIPANQCKFTRMSGTAYRYASVIKRNGVKRPHDGGECPTDMTEIAIYLRDGRIGSPSSFWEFHWCHRGGDNDVIAFIEL